MAQITQILTVPASGAYYFDDLAALQSRSLQESERYTAPPLTPGFQAVREPAEALSVGLVLDQQMVVWGDCAAVEFSGAAGRDPVFRAAAAQKMIEKHIQPLLVGRTLEDFRSLAEEIDEIEITVTEQHLIPKRPPGEKMSRRELFMTAGGLLSETPTIKQQTVVRPLHSSIRYGLSQALLQAAAAAQKKTIPEILCQEWDLPLPKKTVPLHAQCGANRFQGAEKMIIRRVDSLPHSLVDNLPEHLGEEAVHLIQYAKWLKSRIKALGGENYHPTIHLDVHGGLGILYNFNLGEILGRLYALEQAAKPYPLRIECPVICSTRDEQIQAFSTLREYIRFRNMKVQLVADEWANTLEDILAFLEGEAADMIQIKMPDLGGIHTAVDAICACQEEGVGAFLGGSCAETDLSARISAQVALAVQADLVLAKPGMGIDEGISLIRNEMARTLAWLQHKQLN